MNSNAPDRGDRASACTKTIVTHPEPLRMETFVEGYSDLMLEPSLSGAPRRVACDMPTELVEIVFRVPADVGAERVAVCGDFNGWTTDELLKRNADGSFELMMLLVRGQRYQYRFLVDDTRWENDRTAGEYAPNPYGGWDSVIALAAADSSRSRLRDRPASVKRAGSVMMTSSG